MRQTDVAVEKNQYLNFWCVLLAAGCLLIIAKHHHHHLHARGGSTLINKIWDKGNWRIRQMFDLHIIFWCISVLCTIHISNVDWCWHSMSLFVYFVSIWMYVRVRVRVSVQIRGKQTIWLYAKIVYFILFYFTFLFHENANNKHFRPFLSHLTSK